MRGQFAKSQIDPLVIDPYFKQVIYVNNVNDDAVISNFGYDGTANISQSAAPTINRQAYAAKWGTAGMEKLTGTASTNGYLQLNTSGATNYAIGTQDFTMEMWIYYVSTSRTPTTSNFNFGLWSLNTTTGTGNKVWLMQFLGNANSSLWKLNHDIYDGTNWNPPAVYFTPNTWNHICVCRQGSNMYSGTNGVVSLTRSTGGFNLTSITTGTRLGTDANNENQYNAYFDDVRMTVGFARYTKDYPVPEKQLPIPTRPNN